jgi:hypothetical protein
MHHTHVIDNDPDWLRTGPEPCEPMSPLIRKPVAVITLATALIASGALLSCSTAQRTLLVIPDIPDATFVGNHDCYDCHTNYVRAFPSSPHARVHIERAKLAGQSGCESCHGPGSKHVAVGGGRGQFIMNPGKDATPCFQCHLETRAQFSLPQRDPVLEGKMNCVQCHDPHGIDIMKPAGGLAMARMDEPCAQCHREQTKPVVYAHEAMRDGCVT